jgi:large subunit ribosomal protein L13
MQDTQEYTIDARGKRLGKVAGEAAHVLLGKNRTDFAKNATTPVKVMIENVGQLDISEQKRSQKVYTRYSGYPGGLKKTTLQELIDSKGTGEALRKAVYNMLPANRLRKARLKNLVIKEG